MTTGVTGGELVDQGSKQGLKNDWEEVANRIYQEDLLYILEHQSLQVQTFEVVQNSQLHVSLSMQDTTKKERVDETTSLLEFDDGNDSKSFLL